jgi:hypothetical protein
VREVQREVRAVANAKIRAARPDEHELPPTVFRVQPVPLQSVSLLETKKNEIIIIQSLHRPTDDAKLQTWSTLTDEVDETDLQHGAAILVFGCVKYRLIPTGIAFLMLKLFIEPEDN